MYQQHVYEAILEMKFPMDITQAVIDSRTLDHVKQQWDSNALACLYMQ